MQSSFCDASQTTINAANSSITILPSSDFSPLIRRAFFIFKLEIFLRVNEKEKASFEVLDSALSTICQKVTSP